MSNIKVINKTLNNGLRLITISGLSVRSVAMTAYIGAGCRYDPIGKEGLAHLTEHMLFNGTKQFPSHKLEAEAIEKHGGWHIAFTWLDDQYHSLKLPKEKIGLGLSILLDSLYSPIINDAVLEKEKNVVLEEINNNISNSNYALWDQVWMPLLYQETLLSRPYSGNVDSIKNLKTANVKDFLDHYFIPSNTVLVVAGDSVDGVEDEVEKYFSKIPGKKRFIVPPRVKLSHNKRFKQVPYGTNADSSEIGIGVVSVSIEETREKIAIDILKDMLGGYFGTNLIVELKENGGLIYTWRISHDNLLDSGYVMFQTSCANKNVQKVIEIILCEFKRIQTGNFSPAEVDVAKGHLTKSLLINNESPEDFTYWYGSQLIKGIDNPLSMNEYIKIAESISYDELRSVSAKFFSNENILISVLGNADLKSFEKNY